jgi:hypothetical protein
VPRKKDLTASLDDATGEVTEYRQLYENEQKLRRSAEKKRGEIERELRYTQRLLHAQRDKTPDRLSGADSMRDGSAVCNILAVLASMPAYRYVFGALADTLAVREVVAATAEFPQSVRDSNAPGSRMSRQAFIAAVKGSLKTPGNEE